MKKSAFLIICCLFATNCRMMDYLPQTKQTLDMRFDQRDAMIYENSQAIETNKQEIEALRAKLATLEQSTRTIEVRLGENMKSTEMALGLARVNQNEINRIQGKITELEGDVGKLNNIAYTVIFVVGNFACEKAVLSSKLKSQLRDIVVLSHQFGIEIIDIAGYASKEGDPSYNQRLSEKRAKAVKGYLEKQNLITNSFSGEGATDKFALDSKTDNRIVVVEARLTP